MITGYFCPNCEIFCQSEDNSLEGKCGNCGEAKQEKVKIILESEMIFNYTEEQRQIILMGIGHLALSNPGWDNFLSDVANGLNGKEMFENFKKLKEKT